MSRPFVADASVGIKLCLEEEFSAEIAEVFRTELTLVPDLFHIECANVLWKRVKRGLYSRAQAEASVADLIALQLPTTPSIDLMARALALGCEYDVTAYDACYAALAEAKHIPLVTADVRLRQAFSDTSVQVLTVAEYLVLGNEGWS